MIGLYFDGHGPRLRQDLPIPAPGSDEVLLRVLCAGVCRTDLEILKGYMDFSGVMGHELVGEVVKGPDAWLGKRVVAEINCACHACEDCRQGRTNHCSHRTVLGISGRDGVFAEYVAVPLLNLHQVPRGVTIDHAVFTEPLAAAFRIEEQLPLDTIRSAIVLGDGRLGLLCAMALRLRIDDTRLIGKHPRKLALAARRDIKTYALDPPNPDGSTGPLDDATRYAGRADLVVDATGTPDGFKSAMTLVRPRGVLVLKSTFAAEGGLNLAPLVINEIRLEGSRCGPFAVALEALASGRIDPRDLISKRFPLQAGLEALDAGKDPTNLKVCIDICVGA